VTLNGLEQRGRLGNQMWQVAACIGIANQIGAVPHIPPKWSYRKWFSLPEYVYEPAPRGAMPADEWEGLGHIDPRARMYLQDLGLFAHIADDIRSYFSPSKEAHQHMVRLAGPGSITNLQKSDEVIALHVRRGDTVTQPAGFQPLATLDYYVNALRKLDEHYPVFIFSDDPKWCGDRFWIDLCHRAPHSAMIVVDHGNGRSHRPKIYRHQPAMDWVDLQLMATCRHHVMSNSTYAWWSAFLSGDPAPLYPSVWWGPNLAHIDSTIMIPDGWIEVPC